MRECRQRQEEGDQEASWAVGEEGLARVLQRKSRGGSEREGEEEGVGQPDRQSAQGGQADQGEAKGGCRQVRRGLSRGAGFRSQLQRPRLRVNQQTQHQGLVRSHCPFVCEEGARLILCSRPSRRVAPRGSELVAKGAKELRRPYK